MPVPAPCPPCPCPPFPAPCCSTRTLPEGCLMLLLPKPPSWRISPICLGIRPLINSLSVPQPRVPPKWNRSSAPKSGPAPPKLRNGRLTNPVLSANLGSTRTGAHASASTTIRPPIRPSPHHPPGGPSQRPTTRFPACQLATELGHLSTHCTQPLPFAIATTPAPSSLPG